jgi:hypothetical protein
MSVVKLLRSVPLSVLVFSFPSSLMAFHLPCSRIVAPDAVLDLASSGHQLVKNMHDHTFGITSDPLTQFAVVLSALIHDLGMFFDVTFPTFVYELSQPSFPCQSHLV